MKMIKCSVLFCATPYNKKHKHGQNKIKQGKTSNPKRHKQDAVHFKGEDDDIEHWCCDYPNR